jgi:hypothetical protein
MSNSVPSGVAHVCRTSVHVRRKKKKTFAVPRRGSITAGFPLADDACSCGEESAADTAVG